MQFIVVVWDIFFILEKYGYEMRRNYRVAYRKKYEWEVGKL